MSIHPETEDNIETNSLFHEILMALAGFSGELVQANVINYVVSETLYPIINKNKLKDDGGPTQNVNNPYYHQQSPKARNGKLTFKINPDLKFLKESERQILDNIVSIGYDFLILKTFISDIRDISSKSNSGTHDFTRVTSDSQNGIGPTTYQANSVINLNKNHLKLNLSSEAKFGYYSSVFCKCVERVCNLYLKKITQLESEYIKDPLLPIQYILTSLREEKVQLSALRYIIEKNFYDPSGNEITNNNHSIKIDNFLDQMEKSSITGNPILQKVYKAIFEACSRIFIFQLSEWILYGQLKDPYREYFIHKNDKFFTKLYNRSLYHYSQTLYKIRRHEALFEFNHLFQVDQDRIPNCLLSPINANKVLEIGKYVRLLFRMTSYPKDQVNYNLDMERKLKSIIQHENPKFGLECLIDEHYDHVMKQFYDLLINKSELLSHFQFIRDFYLLGKGDFHSHFIEASWERMTNPPNKRSETDLKITSWNDAIISTIAESTKFDTEELKNTQPNQANNNQELRRLGWFAKNLHNQLDLKIEHEEINYQSIPPLSDPNIHLILGGNSWIKNGRLYMSSTNTEENKNRILSKEPITKDPYSAIWLNNKKFIYPGFELSFDFTMDIMDGPTCYFERRRNSEFGCRFAVVLQNDFYPFNVNRDYSKMRDSFWPNYKDCLAIEFTLSITNTNGLIDFNNNSERTANYNIRQQISIYLGSEGVSRILSIPHSVSSSKLIKEANLIGQIADFYINNQPRLSTTHSVDGNSMNDYTPILLIDEQTKTYTLDHQSLLDFMNKEKHIRISCFKDNLEILYDNLEFLYTDLMLNEAISTEMGTTYVGITTLPLTTDHSLITDLTAFDYIKLGILDKPTQIPQPPTFSDKDWLTFFHTHFQ